MRLTVSLSLASSIILYIRLLISVLHQERLHETVEVAVQDTLGVGGFLAGAEVLDHLVE